MQFWDKGIMLVDGCTKVSPGCKNCWSEAMTARFGRVPEVLTDGRFNGKVLFNLHLLEKAVKIKKPQVFAIWNDLYHEGVTDKEIMKAQIIMQMSTHHTFLIITKRIERAAQYIGEAHIHDHIWHIVTCENQAMADERIPHLLRIPGKRGIIIEPMLEAVHFHKKGWQRNRYCCYICDEVWFSVENKAKIDGIHQVILGPENGPGKRPFDPAWAKSVKSQCKAAGVPYYRKDKEEGNLAWREG